jgi:hypothetical protein
MGMVVMSKRELNRLDVLARLDSDRLIFMEDGGLFVWKNFRMATLTLVGNATALGLCLTIFEDFKDKIATDALGGAG